MAKVGEQLLTPEAGWKRIDDTDNKIIYSKGWEKYNSDSLYGNSHHQTNVLNESVIFYFYGTKLRIVNSVNDDRTDNIELTIDGNTYYYSEYSNSAKYKILIFEQCKLKNTFHKVKITNKENKYITLDCIDIDEDGYLLTEEEYNKAISNYIKQDNKYYGFSDDNYDTTTKMYKEVTLDNIKNLEYSNLISNLTKETTIGDETFKPIDKFTNFQLISFYNKPKTIIGSKSKSGLIVANGDIYAGKISNRINSFTLDYTVNNNSAIKMAVSFDNGSTWKTYKDGTFQELSITIPNKYYANMTDEEKTNYSNAKTTILESGFNASDLSSIDFNIDNLDTIRFAYALYQDSINDDCKMSDLSWNFNAKGYLQKMKDSEIGTSFCNGIIKITPLIDCEMIITNYNY